MSNTVCLYWVYTNTVWNSADWTWNDCQLLQEVCLKWGTAGAWWVNANWQWSDCSGSITPPVPPTASVVIQPIGVDASTLVQPWISEPWNPYRAGEIDANKKKRLIKLICKVKGQTYEQEKEVGDMNVSVDDIKMVVKKVLDIDLDVKME